VRVSRDLTGRALQHRIAEWTERPTGYILGPPESTGKGGTIPYYVVIPLPGGVGDLGEGRAMVSPDTGASFRFQLDAVGESDDAAIGALEDALAELCDKVDGEYRNPWSGSTPAPCERTVAGYGVPGKDDAAGIRVASADVQLVVLG
jgi:hypothetical protein